MYRETVPHPTTDSNETLKNPFEDILGLLPNTSERVFNPDVAKQLKEYLGI